MFENFIFFIVALLICTTGPPPESLYFSPFTTLLLFCFLFLVFFSFSRYQFARLARLSAGQEGYPAGRRFSSALTRQSILALLFLAITVHGLHLRFFFVGIPLFKTFPTFETLILMGIFIGYLTLVWSNAHIAHQRIYRDAISRRAYVGAHLSLSLPVLLPWALLSGILDVLFALPSDRLHHWLSSTTGEVTFFLCFLFVIALFGPVMIRKFWRCSPLPPGAEREQIEALFRKAQVRHADILYWPVFGGRMITAGVMGLVGRFRYILVTPSLLRLLSPEEIDAVMAHEAGHIRCHHLVFYLFFLVGYMAISYTLADFSIYFIILCEPFFRLMESLGISRSETAAGLLALGAIFSLIIYFRYVFGYFMRNFERQADGFVYTLFSSALPLITTFRKIAMVSGQSPDAPSWHHFSIRQRIDFLVRCENSPVHLQRHNRKIRISMALYVAILVIIGITGYELRSGWGIFWLNEKALESMIRNNAEGEDRSDIYAMLGDLYFAREKFDQAVSAYERALADNPENASVLNNLAWLLATCPDPAFRNPTRALDLAQKAAARDPSPHVLDTLAESFFVNGKMDAAIDTATRALETATTNTAHYKAQLEKFRATK